MKPDVVIVVCKPRTLSGRRGGTRVALPRVIAEEWIKAGWAEEEKKAAPRASVQH